MDKTKATSCRVSRLTRGPHVTRSHRPGQGVGTPRGEWGWGGIPLGERGIRRGGAPQAVKPDSKETLGSAGREEDQLTGLLQPGGPDWEPASSPLGHHPQAQSPRSPWWEA